MSTAVGDTLRRPRLRRPRRRVTVVGVLGELLITAGVVVMLFLGWQLWLGDIIIGAQLQGESVEQSQVWEKNQADAQTGEPDDPPVMTASANAERFALLVVPRFGADYYRPIAEGVGTTDVLNKGNIGHYPTTQMPGAIGNFAIAAHRSAHGGNFHNLNDLRVGDLLYVETPDGWYAYRFRNLEYVQPTGVGVLYPVPQVIGAEATDRTITLTSCNPFFSTAERIIAYGVFERFYPRADGPPEEIAATVAGGAG
jgi:sortase A